MVEIKRATQSAFAGLVPAKSSPLDLEASLTMSILAALSDDQMALVGGGVVLLASVGLMSLSYAFGGARRSNSQADTVRFETRVDAQQKDESSRRAA